MGVTACIYDMTVKAQHRLRYAEGSQLSLSHRIMLIHIIRPHHLHIVHRMRPIATDVTDSVVCVGHTGELHKNG